MKLNLIALWLCLGMSADCLQAEVVTIDVTIKAVDANGRSITVTKSGKSMKDIDLDVSKKAVIIVDEEEVELDDLKTGQKASITYDSTLEVISKIEIGSGDANSDVDETEGNLFDGVTFKGWKYHPPRNNAKLNESWEIDPERKVLICLGTSWNWIETEKQFESFQCHLEWRFPPGGQVTPSGSGLIVRSKGKVDADVDVPNGLEVQIADGTSGDIFVADVKFRGRQRKNEKGPYLRSMSAEKPRGQWNSLDLECKGENVVVTINGIKVNEGTQLTKRKGRICLLSQNSQVEFRNIRLTPIK